MKKILVLILALLMTMTVFAGCGNANTDTATNDNATVDEATADEEASDSIVIIDAFHDKDYNQYQVKMTSGGVSEIVGGGEFAAVYEKDLTVEELLAQCDYTDFELVDENNGKFLGWMHYTVENEYDKEGYVSDSIYTKVSDKLYTTEEMLSFTVPEGATAFIAKWNGVSNNMYKQIGY